MERSAQRSTLELAVERRVHERHERRERTKGIVACLVAAVAGVLAPAGAMLAWQSLSTWSVLGPPEPHVAASVPSEPPAAPALPEAERRAVYRALIEAEDRALAEVLAAGSTGGAAAGRAEAERLKQQHRRFVELAGQYRDDAARLHGIGPDQVRQIELEGARGAWNAEVEAPSLPDTRLAAPAPPRAEPSQPRGAAEMRRQAVEAPVGLPPRPSTLVRPLPGLSAGSPVAGQ